MRVLTLPFSALALAISSPAMAAPDASGIEQALRDPATAERIDRSLNALTDALLDVKIGGVRAALEGRQADPAERVMTVRDLERRRGRDPEAVRRQIRAAGPAIAKSMNALADAIPAMTRAMGNIENAISRAAANMPDPTYPKR